MWLLCGLFQSVAANERSPALTNDVDLVSIQRQTKRLLPKLTPCVVALPGGSGVIINESGIVLTASHVSRPAGREIEVVLSDGRTVKATTLGSHADSDAGAVKLNGGGPWPFVEVDTSESMNVTRAKPGQWCFGLGYPLAFPRGQAAVVRLGRIHSVSHRRIVSSCTIMGGDSGGPLVSLDGKLLGINSSVKRGISENIHTNIRQFIQHWPSIAYRRDVGPTGEAAVEKAAGVPGLADAQGDELIHLEPDQRTQWKLSAEAAQRPAPGIVESLDNRWTRRVHESVVVVSDELGKKTLGTIVSEAGILVAKSSVLGGTFSVTFFSGQQHPAEVIGVDQKHDLAVVKTVPNVGKPIAFDVQSIVDATRGTMLISVGSDARPIGLGMTIVDPQAFATDAHLDDRFFDQWGGGPFSVRRFDLGTVIAHDTIISPDQCGGPVIDVNGNLVGINIARSLRVATVALPTSTVREVVNSIRPGTIP